MALLAIAIPAAIYLFLAMVGLAWTPSTCLTEERGRISGVSDHDFVISDTNCSTIAKDASVSVFVSLTDGTERTLLLKYSPVNDEFLPAITPVDRKTVLISIPVIASLIFHRDRVDDLTVRYDIGRIVFPDTDSRERR